MEHLHLELPDGARIWLRSDDHFDHANIIRYAGRPYPHLDAMNSDLIQPEQAASKEFSIEKLRESVLFQASDMDGPAPFRLALQERSEPSSTTSNGPLLD